MIAKTILQTLEAYMHSKQCFGVYLSNSNEDVSVEEMNKAVPLLNKEEAMLLWVEGVLFLEFNNREDANNFFNSVVGDDGPTKSNPYDGSARVFALWGEPQSGWLSENT